MREALSGSAQDPDDGRLEVAGVGRASVWNRGTQAGIDDEPRDAGDRAGAPAAGATILFGVDSLAVASRREYGGAVVVVAPRTTVTRWR